MLPDDEEKVEEIETEVPEELPESEEPAVKEEVAEEPESEEPEDEVTVSIGGESPPSEEENRAPDWVRELRKSNRELQRETRELRQKLKEREGASVDLPVLEKKPSLEDVDYDAEKYEEKLASWFEKKRIVDEAKAKAEAESEAQKKTWQSRLDAHSKSKESLKVKDYEDAESAVQETFSPIQQGIIVRGAANSALVMYALGKNPKKAKELAAITDPIEFSFAIARLETQLKVTTRKAPAPEAKVAKGNAKISGSVDSTLERLRADAEKSGDYTKVISYKASKRKVS